MRVITIWLPTLAWALVIFLFSSKPTGVASEIHWQDFIIKKLAHVTEYAILTVFLYRSFRLSGFSKKNAIFTSLTVAIFYGMTDEVHQSFTPGREPRARDVIFDTIGATIAAISIWKLLPNLPPKLSLWAKKLGMS